MAKSEEAFEFGAMRAGLVWRLRSNKDGGQGGCAGRHLNQPLKPSAAGADHIEKFEEFGGASNPVQTAALWLSQHRDECRSGIIPLVREMFGLSILEAIEALKQGHALRYGGA